MTLEELIYSRLTEKAELTAKLAMFGKKPAIFYQTAPGDQDKGWKGSRQYPRIDFTVDMQANAERQTSGLMALNIWCHETSAETPEKIEPEVQAALRDIFMQPEEGPPYCMRWARSDNFETRVQIGNHVIGITVLFDVLAFPIQETADPDPIMTMNRFIREWAPEAVIIGVDRLPAYFMAGEKNPAFYFRIANLGLERETNAVAWMTATIAGHIIAPTAEARLTWLKSLVDTLALRGEVTMPDSSPMFIKNIRANSAADYLSTGQLAITVSFGILRRPAYAHPLNHAYTKEV